MDGFGFIVCNLHGDASDSGVVIAAIRCGAMGLLNCAGMDPETIRESVARIRQAESGPFGIKLDIPSLHLLAACREAAPRVFFEVSSAEQAARAAESGCDGVIARGLPLAIELAATSRVPVWATGIGPDAAMTCRAAGISGVVIEQAPLADAARSLPVILESWRIALDHAGAPTDTDSAGSTDAVMLQFQHLMTQFLETQAAVMRAYLENAGKAAAAPAHEERVREASAAATEAGPGRPEDSASPARDYTAELRGIASARTSFPAEMLDPDAAIETDLGIDSVKRAEILGDFQKLCSPTEREKIQAIMESLACARTLGDIAERIATVLPGGVSVSRQKSPRKEIPRFVLTVTAKPRRPAKPRYYPGRISIITDDETGIAAGIAEELNNAGERAILLRHNPDTIIGADDLFTTDLTDAEAIEAAVRMIRQEHGPIGAIIHLLPLRSSWSLAQCSFAQWRELVQLDVHSLHALARAAETDLRQAGRDAGALFATVTGCGGDFGLHATPAAPPTHFAAADFTKAAALEIPEVLCRVVDLDAADPVLILQKKLIEELTSPDETLQVGLPGDRRLAIVAQAEHTSAGAGKEIQRDWVVLVTGGASGITAEIARRMAEQRQPVLVIADASPLPGPEPEDTAGLTDAARIKAALTARLKGAGTALKPATVEAAYQALMKEREIVRTLETLRGTGSRVEYATVDVRDANAFGAFIDGIYRDYGRLDVVIHGAGMADDKFIREKTPESFSRVMRTKSDGAFVLSRKLRPESLRCLLFMSSITAPFGGNRGHADYAAANGILNGFAGMLHTEWPGRVVALNWGPWEDPGTLPEEVRPQLHAHGIRLISAMEAAQAVLDEIEAGPPQDALVVLGEGPWVKTALPSGTPRLQVHAFGGMP